MHENDRESMQLEDTSGYIASHSGFNLSVMAISSLLNSSYYISLSFTTVANPYKWLYLNLIYFDTIDCNNTSTGLVIKKQEEENILHRICTASSSMPQNAIRLDGSAKNLDLKYEFQQTAGDQRRGFILFYKGRIFSKELQLKQHYLPRMRE